MKKCIYCNKELVRSKSDWNERWEKRKYCNTRCSGLATNTLYKKGHPGMTGESNPWWKGGIISYHSGYLKKRIDNKKYRPYHRWIMEQHLGRNLTRNEVVHHINLDKTDNRVENLQVMDIADHTRLHWEIRRKSLRNEPINHK